MAHSRTVPPIPIAVLALIAAGGRVIAASGLSDAGNWASIAAAVFAFLILVAGGVRWIRQVVAERRAARLPRKDYGRLDYEPEFSKAAAANTEAQQEIAKATGKATAVWVQNRALSTQAQADEIAAASHDMCAVYERLLPVLDESDRIMRVCFRGLVSTWHITSNQDRDGVLQLRQAMRGSRDATSGYLRALRGNRRSAATVRKKNLSSSLNESAKRQQVLLKRARRTVRRALWGRRVAVWRLSWFLLLFSLFTPLRKLREQN